MLPISLRVSYFTSLDNLAGFYCWGLIECMIFFPHIKLACVFHDHLSCIWYISCMVELDFLLVPEVMYHIWNVIPVCVICLNNNILLLMV